MLQVKYCDSIGLLQAWPGFTLSAASASGESAGRGSSVPQLNSTSLMRPSSWRRAAADSLFLLKMHCGLPQWLQRITARTAQGGKEFE